MSERQLKIDTEARARRTDPHTSHEAADSVRNQNVTHTRILRLLDTYGNLCDTDIAYALTRASHGEVTVSASGLRTRRSELVSKGYVEDSGLRSRLPSGRRSIIWKITQAGREAL